jgi:hypothetical protein
MALNDFTYISNKIRRVTGRTSPNQITDDEIRDYVNSFMIYDLPLHTRLFYNKNTYTTQLDTNVAVYPITAIKNLYSNFEPPAYIDGFQIQYFQDDQAFFQVYPRLKYSVTLTTGSGIAGPYNGTYSYTPIEPGTAVVSTVDALGNSLIAVDDSAGGFTGDVAAGATINYETGVIANLTFTALVPAGETIFVSATNYIVGRPLAVLYFKNEFRFWPFPDRAYTFQIGAWPNPQEFTSGGGAAFPELNEWADVIAFGASLKIFQDNLDTDSFAKVKVFFDESKRLAERRTMKQLSNQRVSTIYDDGIGWPSQFYGFPYG